MEVAVEVALIDRPVELASFGSFQRVVYPQMSFEGHCATMSHDMMFAYTDVCVCVKRLFFLGGWKVITAGEQSSTPL